MKFKCVNCQAIFAKWVGKCSCGEWNTLIECTENEIVKKNPSGKHYFPVQFDDLAKEDIETNFRRLKTDIQEFDKTIGGGLVPGGVILISGDPGIGKSTLLLQISNSNLENRYVLYISGEESVSQVKLRAKRLNIENANLKLSSMNVLEEILSSIEPHKGNTALIIIDSIQTIYSSLLEGGAGSVSQIKYCAQKLIEFAKKENIALIIVGHVTKEGTLAGPKLLEHSVDTVLHFEGERNYMFRVLRSVKNRFGATDEIGIFEIKETGLEQVLNPSLMFLNQQRENATGSVIFPSFEGSRPLMVEIQALVSPSFLQMPRRAVIGWDQNRLPMICAVLEKHCKVALGNKDVYLTVMSGLRIQEPAADLAILLAIISSHLEIPVPTNLIAFGEIGLSGEIRSSQHTIKRIEEAKKLNCKGVLTSHLKENFGGFVKSFADVREVVSWVKTLKKA
jgi:DNA repair protein RadA/Sms